MVLGASFQKWPIVLPMSIAHWQKQDQDQTCCQWEWNNPHFGGRISFLLVNIWAEYVILGYFFCENNAILFPNFCQAWWLMPVITALEKPKQEDYHEFEVILLHREFQFQSHSETLHQTAQYKCDASLNSGPLCKSFPLLQNVLEIF